MSIIVCIDVCVERISGYGLVESRCRVGYEYAGKVGYNTLSPDLPKSLTHTPFYTLYTPTYKLPDRYLYLLRAWCN